MSLEDTLVKATINYNKERIKREISEKRESIYKEALEMIKQVVCRCNCFMVAEDALKKASEVKGEKV